MQLVYIHGFNSSPQSHKARVLKQWLAGHPSAVSCVIPCLSPFPAQAIEQLEKLTNATLQQGERVGLVGSSLGGFYAAWLAEKYGLRAVLVNPSVYPFNTLAEHLGENRNYHNDDFYIFEQKHVDELRTFFVEQHSRPENLLLMVQSGDEVLDFKEATRRYFQSQNIIEWGGDHGYQHFERWLPHVLAFLNRD